MAHEPTKAKFVQIYKYKKNLYSGKINYKILVTQIILVTNYSGFDKSALVNSFTLDDAIAIDKLKKML